MVIGLTGSIGMGKSTVARMFKRLGVPVHEADACVHALLSPKGAAFDAVKKAFPKALIRGRLDRKLLGAIVFADPNAKSTLEGILHPLIRKDRKQFLQTARMQGHKLAVIDVPLLFETGIYKTVDHILVVTAPIAVQTRRVLARPNMTMTRLNAIRKAQWSDARKRANADTVINTANGYHATFAALKQKMVEWIDTPNQTKPPTPAKRKRG